MDQEKIKAPFTDVDRKELHDGDILTATLFNGEEYETEYQLAYDHGYINDLGWYCYLLKGNEKAMAISGEGGTGLFGMPPLENMRLRKDRLKEQA